MKKVSTAVTMQSRKFYQQKLTIGPDLGDVDDGGQVQLEQRVSTTAKSPREVFGGMPCSRIAL